MNNEKGKIIFENNSESFIERQSNGLPKAPRTIPMPKVKPCKEVIEVFNGVYKDNKDELINSLEELLSSSINDGDEIKIIIEKRKSE